MNDFQIQSRTHGVLETQFSSRIVISISILLSRRDHIHVMTTNVKHGLSLRFTLVRHLSLMSTPDVVHDDGYCSEWLIIYCLILLGALILSLTLCAIAIMAWCDCFRLGRAVVDLLHLHQHMHHHYSQTRDWTVWDPLPRGLLGCSSDHRHYPSHHSRLWHLWRVVVRHVLAVYFHSFFSCLFFLENVQI